MRKFLSCGANLKKSTNWNIIETNVRIGVHQTQIPTYEKCGVRQNNFYLASSEKNSEAVYAVGHT